MFITGSGVISSAGSSPSELWVQALSGKSAISEGLGRIYLDDLKNPQDRAYYFFMSAAQQAMHSAGWDKLNSDDGVIIGTTTGQIRLWDQALINFNRQKISFYELQQAFAKQPLGTLINRACETSKKALGQTEHQMLITSACTASTQAIAMATMWLKQKKVKRVLVGGVETLSPLTVEGFKSLQLLSPTVCTPFDKDRKGINLSEGAAFICLEPQRTEKTLAALSGFGLSTDAFHITSPHPDGKGTQICIKNALQMAKLKPSDIDWIHAHGTGSNANDLAEGTAIQKIFSNHCPPVSSTKAIHGHMLAASGVLETVLCIEALRNQQIIRSQGLNEADSKIQINLAKENKKGPLKHIVKNTLGFGGANAAIILSHPDAARTQI